MTPKVKFLLALLAAGALLAGCSREILDRATAPESQSQVETTKPTDAAKPDETATEADKAAQLIPQPLATVARQPWNPGSPEERAQAFYDWYVSYNGNVLADRAYRDSPYIHPSWISTVDDKLKEWEASGAPGFDPFLCAQDRLEVIAGPATIVGTDAVLLAYHGPWGGPSPWKPMEVYLTMQGEQWRIVRVSCIR